jgi:RNA polymerase sigma-70 factor (ECF subfamily)
MTVRQRDAEEFFTVGWPDLVPRLRAMLARAGAPVAEREDLVQETALRLFRMWDSVDPERPVEPLARRIAMNVWHDQWRRRGEHEVTGDVPDVAAGADTERAALARVQVLEVSRALSTLPATTARVLRVAARDAECGPEQVRTPTSVRMARSRARRALVACLKVASALVVAVASGIRSLSRPATTGTAVGALATVAWVLAVAAPSVGTAPALQREGRPFPAAQSAPGPADIRAASPVMPSRVARRSAAAAHPHTPAAATATEPPYYVVNAGPTQVGAFADVSVSGYGVRVSQPEPGTQLPACTYGASPATAVTPRCSQP